LNNDREDRRPALLVRTQSVACALSLSDVAETMRALPVEPLGGMPRFVRGVSIIRGSAVPVVDLALLLGASEGATSNRLVTLRVGDRRVALAVETVLGVRELDLSSMPEMPPLLGTAAAEVLDTIGTLDGALLLVLQAARIVPPEVWQALASREASA
jgi:purine-binding chemotaxis protein CheW